MPTDAGDPNVVSNTTSERAGSPADLARRAAACRSQLDAASTIRATKTSPTVEVELTWARPRPATRAGLRLNVAWLLFGAFGLTSLLAGTTSDPRTGELIASGLVLPLYLLTIGALVWAALETRCSTRRRSFAPLPQLTGHVGHPSVNTARASDDDVPSRSAVQSRGRRA
jgi:hypothetical protein